MSFSKFLLVGNSSYRNRGCEAIVRGTMNILRGEFGTQVRALAGVFGTKDVIAKQNAVELDPAVRSFALSGLSDPKWSLRWCATQVSRRLRGALRPDLEALQQPAQAACAALKVGGDLYTLDYGRPETQIQIDRFLQAQGLPVVLWGSSVGPFDADPSFAPRIFQHLRGLSGIFVRERDSLDYLRANGISDNVHFVADPAFLLPPVEPAVSKVGFPRIEGAVGLNLSPLLARFRSKGPSEGSLDDWLRFCIHLVERAGGELQRPILLVPHVGSPSRAGDDFSFLQAVCQAVREKGRIQAYVLPRGLNAGETKWLIGRCLIFAGARTHSTIAAMSSHVPTLSIGYSRKAAGIARDVFAHREFCIPVSELNAENFTAQLKFIFQNRSRIRAHLVGRIPELCARARSAGPLLRQILTPQALFNSRNGLKPASASITSGWSDARQ